MAPNAYALIKRLFPICRSITGDGIRASLNLLRDIIPLEIHEVPTGTQVFDWTVPKEWNIRDAYIKDNTGRRIVDFRDNNLHVLNYSIPVHRKMRLAELTPRLFTLPDHPDWIPYRTSYYQENWGFCLSHNQLERLNRDEEYEVCIDTDLEDGSLTYGEYFITGATKKEMLISCHSCHPSLCNDNLSGMAVSAFLAQALGAMSLRYSYRFIWIPGTIGSITWLALNEACLPDIKHGLVLSCLGDTGPFHYKRSRHGNAEIDRAVEHTFRHHAPNSEMLDFSPYGYDERQYGSPGINLPVGCFMRTPNGQYPEYHTSADDLNFVTIASLDGSLTQLLRVIQVLEENKRYINLNPKCEPQLGRRGLYRQVGGLKDIASGQMAILWILNLSDGKHDLLDIANQSGMPFHQIAEAASLLCASELLEVRNGLRPAEC
ncbi:MAG: DUF4910 domain-containing protein [Verrucomicrobia bacterium]|nr:DUF4910 domain-containing protein [Verrucomicrobiota bacterium]